LATQIEQTLAKYRRVILVGGSGLGKSLVAREVAGRKPAGFFTVDLRDADARETTQRLGLTLGRIGALTFDCLIFDDFNQIEDGQARTAFVRCVQALQRRDRSAIVTAYRRPSQKTLTELGLDAEAVIGQKVRLCNVQLYDKPAGVRRPSKRARRRSAGMRPVTAL
jgi:chromosomal replication initiation ATPase DnaA